MSTPNIDRRAKARTVRSLRSQLDHALLMRSIGQPVEQALVDQLGDQLYALARTEPLLTLAEVSRPNS